MKRLVQNRMQSDGLKWRGISKMPEQKQLNRRRVLGEEGEKAATLDRIYAASGFEAARTSLWQQRLERLNEQEQRRQYVAAIEYVNAYARSGDKEQAFTWLGKALEERNRFAFEVKSNPIYDNLSKDPRFQDLLKRSGFTS